MPNRQGETETLLDDGRMLRDPRLSPNGTRVALTSLDGANLDVWRFDLDRRTLTRVTSHPGEDFQPVWSPDGNYLAFGAEIDEDADNIGPGLAWIDASSEQPESLLRTPGLAFWEFPSSWSPDGQWLAFTAMRNGSAS